VDNNVSTNAFQDELEEIRKILRRIDDKIDRIHSKRCPSNITQFKVIAN